MPCKALVKPSQHHPHHFNVDSYLTTLLGHAGLACEHSRGLVMLDESLIEVKHLPEKLYETVQHVKTIHVAFVWPQDVGFYLL